jgi:hypothetical protein
MTEKLRSCDRCRECFLNEKFMDDWVRAQLSDGTMPAEVWDSIRGELQTPRRTIRFSYLRMGAPAVLIALAVIVAAVYYPRNEAESPGPRQTITALLTRAAPQLVAYREAPAADVPAQLASLSRSVVGATVHVDLARETHHDISLIGVAKRVDCAGHPYVELRLNCCGHPVLMVLCRKCNGSAICELCSETGGAKPQKPSCCPHSAPSDVVTVASVERKGIMVAAAAANHPVDAVMSVIEIDPA